MKKKVAITGAHGFVGKNLRNFLQGNHEFDCKVISRNTTDKMVKSILNNCEYLIHLAGTNIPNSVQTLESGNEDYARTIIGFLTENAQSIGVIYASSQKATLDTPYGQSKRNVEILFEEYHKKTGAKVCIYRLENIFGKWCKPNYNSAISTFCNNISRGLKISVNKDNPSIELVHIDDVCGNILSILKSNESQPFSYYKSPITYSKKLYHLVDLIRSFKKDSENGVIPNMQNRFEKLLFSVYHSYQPSTQFKNYLKTYNDHRGSLFEYIKSFSAGQIFISKTKSGITRGNHYHNRKVEKFLVVHGQAEITLLDLHNNKKISLQAHGDKPAVIEIPVGYSHKITNTGDGDLITIFWANEIFDPETPDTYPHNTTLDF